MSSKVEIRSIVDPNGKPLSTFPVINGQAFDGLRRPGTEMLNFQPSMGSADADILPAKRELDAKSRDNVRNDGYISGARRIHVDNIVGHQFKLNARPNYRMLMQINPAFDEEWARDFSQAAEARFENWAGDPDCWIDVARVQNFTSLVRSVAGQLFDVGEVLSQARWLKRGPYRTAMQMIDVERLSNPFGKTNDDKYRRGVELNRRGAPVAYHVQVQHPSEGLMGGSQPYKWRRVSRYKSWGRLQMLHLFDRERPDQNRGIGMLTSILQELQTTKRYKKLVLQNLAVNAMYAATLESDLDRELAMQSIGVEMEDGTTDQVPYLDYYMNQTSEYSANAPNLKLDGVKIPHLPPGTKLQLQGTAASTIGEGFEKSLLRNLAAGAGISYEQLSRDYSETNYSSARSAILESWKFFLARRHIGPGKFATQVYGLWLEEAMAANELPMPTGATTTFWDQKNAFSTCVWHGAGRGQIDPLKETQASVLKISSGLSTYEKEMGELHGEDWREVFEQQAREKAMRKELSLDEDLNANKPLSTEPTDDDRPDKTNPKKPKKDKDADGDGIENESSYLEQERTLKPRFRTPMPA